MGIIQTVDETVVIARAVARVIQDLSGKHIRCEVYKEHHIDHMFQTGFLVRVIFDKNWGSRKVDGAGDLAVDTYAIDYQLIDLEPNKLSRMVDEAVAEIKRICEGGLVRETPVPLESGDLTNADT